MAVLPGAGAFGKGSTTKARLAPPFWMRPLERPQLELIKVCVEELDWVACGIGREVLVETLESPYTDAAAVVLWENACTL